MYEYNVYVWIKIALYIYIYVCVYMCVYILCVCVCVFKHEHYLESWPGLGGWECYKLVSEKKYVYFVMFPTLLVVGGIT
jgi:hypothetical protein